MATHSSVFAWRIPGTGEPGGLPSVGVAQSRTQLKRLSTSWIYKTKVQGMVRSEMQTWKLPKMTGDTKTKTIKMFMP